MPHAISPDLPSNFLQELKGVKCAQQKPGKGAWYFRSREPGAKDLTEWMNSHEQRPKKGRTGSIENAGIQYASMQPSGDSRLHMNRGSVLCESTIWCPYWDVSGRWGAMWWPLEDERKLDGDDRLVRFQEYRRFLPLVRCWPHEDDVEGFEQIKQWGEIYPNKAVCLGVDILPQYAFDDVRRLPTYEDIYHRVEEIDDADVRTLLNNDLLAALIEDDGF